jgi:hypothetical protein
MLRNSDVFNWKICFILSYVALLIIPSTCFSQLYYWHDIPEPVPYSGGNYTMHVQSPPFDPMWMQRWWEASTSSFVYVDGQHYIWKWSGGVETIGINVSRNEYFQRQDSVVLLEYIYDYDYNTIYLNCADQQDVQQEAFSPSTFSCDPNPIHVLPNGINVTFSTDICGYDVELKYTYNGGSTVNVAGPYHTDSSGQWILWYGPETISQAGEYHFIGIRNADGGSWVDIDYTIILDSDLPEAVVEAALDLTSISPMKVKAPHP